MNLPTVVVIVIGCNRKWDSTRVETKTTIDN